MKNIYGGVCLLSSLDEALCFTEALMIVLMTPNEELYLELCHLLHFWPNLFCKTCMDILHCTMIYTIMCVAWKKAIFLGGLLFTPPVSSHCKRVLPTLAIKALHVL